MSLEDRVSFHVAIARERFANTITSVLVASQIAKPGVLRTNELEIWVNNQCWKTTNSICGVFGEVVEFTGKNSWPNIETLSIKEVWRWMRSCDPLPNSLGKTALERALNAVTYLLSGKPIEGAELVDLMWAMVGLEALYGRGTSDLTYQLVEKATVLLGQYKGFEKSLKEMYNLRSKFLHGKASFPSALFDSEGLREYERYSDKSNDATMLASAVLIATLQQMVKHNWKNLSFSFVADDPPRET
jgi:hypothetical protein